MWQRTVEASPHRSTLLTHSDTVWQACVHSTGKELKLTPPDMPKLWVSPIVSVRTAR